MEESEEKKGKTGGIFGRLKKVNTKFVLLSVVTFTSLFALSAGTIAWFLTVAKSSEFHDVISGDLDVDIKKVTALKYVYPYYKNSTEFIDYGVDPSLKSYVIEDSEYSVNNPSSGCTVSLSTVSGQYFSDPSAEGFAPNASKIHFESSQDFRYYLVGDSLFSGQESNQWSTLSSCAFASRELLSITNATINNVVLSTGATFILFNSTSASNGACNYLNYGSITASESGKSPRFEVVQNQSETAGIALKCLKGGIYSFNYWHDANSNSDKLTITLTGKDGDVDSVIGNGVFDPTKVNLDFAGSTTAKYSNNVNYFIPDAIKSQCTMVVLDVELEYKNANKIKAGLEVRRDSSSVGSAPVINDPSKNTTGYETGYVDSNNRNPLRASNFYSYYAVFAPEEYKYVATEASGDDPAYTQAENIYNAMHMTTANLTITNNVVTGVSDRFDKFIYDSEKGYETLLDCTIHEKGASSITTISSDADWIIPPATSNRYHCYIAIEYDYQYSTFFFASETGSNRMGKTYLLDRDFTFKFTAVQVLEGQS